MLTPNSIPSGTTLLKPDPDEETSLEWQLLDDNTSDDSGDEDREPMSQHDVATAPLFTREAFQLTKGGRRVAQYGVLGKAISAHHQDVVETFEDPRLYINTNAPFSAIICGVQGSGKSHTVSTILENMLISKFQPIGTLEKPLCGLVLHYGEGGNNALPNETAWLSTSLSSLVKGPQVKVYVSRSSLQTMKRVYARFEGKVVVEPLLLQNSELDAAAILSMMAVGSSESAPLYMQIILSILRDLGETFTYKRFMEKLEISKQKFNPAQMTGLEQRLSLLNAFLDTKVSTSKQPRFKAGQLTIIDLSDPFLDSASACSLFEIVVRLFIRADVGTGKVLVVDEAHKYLSHDRTASGLTKALLELIRQQRHLGMRVLISTQGKAHYIFVSFYTSDKSFSSPNWWQHLIQHVPTDFSHSDAFDKVVKLQTGQAMLLAASGIGVFTAADASDARESPDILASGKVLAHFGRRYLIIKTRKRITADGGGSILVLS
ncbi:hypothetical protein CVT24_003609 [Panaeolus cyanescens]|uniref:Zona occludens toxin N-terminal domain-containing protein n=1 Tax=Panaeolus cyanescens TaxID=181874 RepID=A0A409Y7V2_9AGAR|nr:hypothetical protein CVT24_003609 [Panaeolus cyanescens]